MKLLKHLGAIISVFLLIAAIVFTAYNINALRKNTPIKVFGYRYSLVVSGSMEDYDKLDIKIGNYVIYEQQEEYLVGDVIVYRSLINNKLIVHEIIDENHQGFITQGTNNNASDLKQEGYITNDRILGKVTKTTTLLGLGKLFTNNRNAVLLVVILISLIITVWQIVDIIKAFNEKEKLQKAEELKKYKENLLEEKM